jgi:putative lipoprotein
VKARLPLLALTLIALSITALPAPAADTPKAASAETPKESPKDTPKEPAAPPAKPLPTITGTVEFAQPLVLGSEAVAEISLLAVPAGAEPIFSARTLGKQIIKDPKKFPFPFAVPYDPAAIKPAGRYSISVRLTFAGGQLLFKSDAAAPVLTHDSPSKDVKVTVVRVKEGMK